MSICALMEWREIGEQNKIKSNVHIQAQAYKHTQEIKIEGENVGTSI